LLALKRFATHTLLRHHLQAPYVNACHKTHGQQKQQASDRLVPVRESTRRQADRERESLWVQNELP